MDRKEMFSKAKELGVKVSGSMKTVDLEAAIENAEREAETKARAIKLAEEKIKVPEVKTTKIVELTEEERFAKQRSKAVKLVRCIVSPREQHKSDWDGEFFSCGNSKIGFIKKFVRFGEEWHLPQIIFNTIKEKKVIVHRSKKVDGKKVTEPAEIPAYSIQELDPLTPEEIKELKETYNRHI